MFDIIEASQYFQSRVTIYNLTTTPQQVAANEPQRVLLYFTSGLANTAGLNSVIPQLLAEPQFWVTAGSTVRFTWPLDGYLTTIPWYANASGGTAAMTVTEVWFRPPRGQH